MTFEVIDVVMAAVGGGALGFVIGASIMKYTMTITMKTQQDLREIENAFKAVLSIPPDKEN